MIHILFIGNSYTQRNDLPGLLTKLAASRTAPIQIETQRIIANGMSLNTHWTRGQALELIGSRKWTFVVLQEQSTAPFKKREQMHQSVRLFDFAIKNHSDGARTVLYLTWARRNDPARQTEINDAYYSIAREIGAMVAPAGPAWAAALAERPKLSLYTWDRSHPAYAGTYLAACVFFATLFGESPIGLSAESLKPDDALFFQNTAWQVVRQLPASDFGRNIKPDGSAN